MSYLGFDLLDHCDSVLCLQLSVAVTIEDASHRKLSSVNCSAPTSSIRISRRSTLGHPIGMFRRRVPYRTAKGWIFAAACLLAINLLLAARSMVHRMPHGDPNQNIKTITDSLSTQRSSRGSGWQERLQGINAGGTHRQDETENRNEAAEAWIDKKDDALLEEKDPESIRLERLRGNESLPMVYFDVTIKENPVGRIEMVLFPDVSPRAAENFRQLCTGEAGTVPNKLGREGAGMPLHFKGASFYRIIDQFIDQSGINTESIFGGRFKDDPGGLKLKHEHKGLLSMANMGPDTNTAHFSIMMGNSPHLDGKYTIFGQVVSGFDVVDAVNALSKGKPERTATAADGAVISDCGQIRRGTIIPNLQL